MLHSVLRDTTALHSNVKPGYKNLGGNRVRSTADARYETPFSKTTPGSRRSTGSAGYLTDSPPSAGRFASNTPACFSPSTPIPTPSKSLFRTYLLREIPPTERKPTLTVVLDLDETLVSNRRPNMTEAILRPHVMEALHRMRALPNLELVVWTASTEETGSAVVDQLHEEGVIFDDVIYRNSLWFTEPVHSKDLRLLGRDMDRVVIFDNAANCCKLNPKNALLVDDFLGVMNSSDCTMINMYHVVHYLLQKCAQGGRVPDVLEYLASSTSFCRPVFYNLPEAWENVNLRDIAPLTIPPHGKFNRLLQVSVASQRC